METVGRPHYCNLAFSGVRWICIARYIRYRIETIVQDENNSIPTQWVPFQCSEYAYWDQTCAIRIVVQIWNQGSNFLQTLFKIVIRCSVWVDIIKEGGEQVISRTVQESKLKFRMKAYHSSGINGDKPVVRIFPVQCMSTNHIWCQKISTHKPCTNFMRFIQIYFYLKLENRGTMLNFVPFVTLSFWSLTLLKKKKKKTPPRTTVTTIQCNASTKFRLMSKIWVYFRKKKSNLSMQQPFGECKPCRTDC